MDEVEQIIQGCLLLFHTVEVRFVLVRQIKTTSRKVTNWWGVLSVKDAARALEGGRHILNNDFADWFV